MIHPLLPELIELQNRDRYLRPEALAELSRKLSLSLNHIYSVASFYHAFRFTPCGKHQIKVCIGAACYVKGAEAVYDAFASHLGLTGDQDTSADGLFTLSKVACLGCCMLAVAVQIDRHIFGQVKPGNIPQVIKDFLQLASEEDAAAEAGSSSSAPGQTEIRLCCCSSCRAAGSARIMQALQEERQRHGLEFSLKSVGCHGLSFRAPLLTVFSGGLYYHYDQVQEHTLKTILGRHLSSRNAIRQIGWQAQLALHRWYNRSCACQPEVSDSPAIGQYARLVTANSGQDQPEDIAEYQQHGGFQALQRVAQMPPEQVLQILEAAQLRGRGGGGFPTGQKWRLAFSAKHHPKVVVCNADEGDPGAFMDRMLLESYPCRVLEGILIAACVLQAKHAIIYIRDEYAQAVGILQRILNKLQQTPFYRLPGEDFQLHIFKGAGAFVCGEETALLESLQGQRGIPRRRPPFPVSEGLHGLPTLINNVETFACIPIILQDDGELFRSYGTASSKGTKAFALAGKVRQGGLIEVPIGISIAEIVEKYGGGAEAGHTVKAVMIGGPSGGCIPYRNFSLPVDYETLQQHGAMMGSGGLVVLDERDCLVDLSLYFLRFLKDESCGKCVFCREGLQRLCALLEELTRAGSKAPELLIEIDTLARHIKQGALCALGQTAPNMVLSAMHAFRAEFEEHLQGHCPAGKCRELTEFQVGKDCIGCSKCAQSCAAKAIVCVPLESARIDQSKCVKCGVCRSICPRNAIRNVLAGAPAAAEQELPFPLFQPRTVSPEYIAVDGQEYPFREGWRLLDYAQEQHWEIPTLCHLEEKKGSAHCLVCAAWDASIGRFVPSCEQLVQPGHVYELQGEHVRAFRREALALMLRRHDFRCGTCTAKGDCRFFTLIRAYGAKKAKNSEQCFPARIESRHLTFESGKCILCHRCTTLAGDYLSMHHRSEAACVSPAPGSWNDIPAELCRRLAESCPCGALHFTE